MENEQQERKPAAAPNEDPEDSNVDLLEDDESDNWSRQVTAAEDETTTMMMIMDDNNSSSSNLLPGGVTPAVARHPHTENLTMKERLVLRERQRRIETERARLKRQFVLNATDTASLEEAASLNSAEKRNVEASSNSARSIFGEESTRAHADEETQEKLGFNMERFLRNSDSFQPPATIGANECENDNSNTQNKVLMERFLSEPITASAANAVNSPPTTDQTGAGGAADVHRSVSFDVEASTAGAVCSTDVPPSSLHLAPNHSFASSTGAAADDDEDVDDDPSLPIIDDSTMNAASTEATGQDEEEEVSQQSSSNEPRLLRLTEADMQELAAIEEASIGNAPPSEREEEDMLSEIAELVDFARGSGGNAHGQDTPTTVQDSVSLMSGGGGRAASEIGGVIVGEHEMGHHLNFHRPSDTPLSPGAVSALETHPPSVIAHDGTEVDIDELDAAALHLPLIETGPPLTGVGVNEHHPGLVEPESPSTPPHLSPNSSPEQQQPHSVVDGFDFDKHHPSSPPSIDHGGNSYQDLPLDDHDTLLWCPNDNKMQVSPIRPAGRTVQPSISHHAVPQPFLQQRRAYVACDCPGESTPLLSSLRDIAGTTVPPEILTRQLQQQLRQVQQSTDQASDGASLATSRVGTEATNSSAQDVQCSRCREWVRVESIFSDVRSEEEFEKEEEEHECDVYLRSSNFARAMPERMFALTVTLLFELPVLLMISGGSDSLCALVGKRKYHLLMGFIPLTSAISGNVGLQASTLTTRAISHRQVTAQSYSHWFSSEVGAASYLGIGMGMLLGSIAFFAGGWDIGFGLTIFLAQFISIMTAGVTGTFAPLLFSFVFKRDSGKWGGPLETAIQDIVGSFAMVIISYHILEWFGVSPLDSWDICGVADIVVDDDEV